MATSACCPCRGRSHYCAVDYRRSDRWPRLRLIKSRPKKRRRRFQKYVPGGVHSYNRALKIPSVTHNVSAYVQVAISLTS
ncbi:hypothetical protein ACVWY2_004217 [Bradyrhizobium sp. JR6.1]